MENSNTPTVKFTQEEMTEISALQRRYQEKVFQLGQIKLDEISLEDAVSELEKKKNEVLDQWKQLQVNEQELLKKLADKYGDGSLSLKDGTFTPAQQSVQEPVLNEQINQQSTVSAENVVQVPNFSQVP